MAQVPATQRNQAGRLAARREHPLERLYRDFDSLFGQLWGGWPAAGDQEVEIMRLWDFRIEEKEGEIVVRAELPGFEENEIDVQVNNDVLTIKAEKEQKDEQHEEYRNFFRRITLPSGIDAGKARATYHNGVLELHIPRAEEARPRRIEVQKEQANGGTSGTDTSQAPRQGQQTTSNQAAATSSASQSGKAGQGAGTQTAETSGKTKK